MATTPRFMNQIEHVVLVMLENRSFDSLLGWLYETDQPARIIPAGSSPSYDGLNTGTYSNQYKGRTIPVTRGTLQAHQPMRVPRIDPHETYGHVTLQLFGDGVNHMPSPPPSGTPANMLGFAQDFDSIWESWAELDEVVTTYLPSQLPALCGLAKNYAVSDRWFSSVPTQTNPNRAFAHCGTSLGRTVNGELSTDQFDTDTIWNALPPDVSWGVYFQDIWTAGKCFTHFSFPRIDKAKAAAASAEIAPLAQFYAHAKAGTLPAFSFLEPAWGYGEGTPDGFVGRQGNDYHPPTWIGPGEAFIADVYNALSSNPALWATTLLVITFDEHGGIYDHVDPGWGAIKPDGYSGPDGFQFDRYGVRVPMILASPWIPAGTVFRAPSISAHPFDHCSLIATILKWQGVDPAGAGLGLRVAAAPTFEAVLSDTTRSDVPQISVPADYAHEEAGVLKVSDAGLFDMIDVITCVERSHDLVQMAECLKKIKSPTG